MARRDPVPLVLLCGMLACLLALPVLATAPNRLAEAHALPVAELFAGYGWALPALIVLTAAASRRPAVLAALAALLLAALLAACGTRAAALAAAGPAAGRVSLGLGFWGALILAGLLIAHAARRIGPTGGAILLLALLVAVTFLLVAGWLDALGPLREYATMRAVFWAALLRHVVMVATTMALALATAVPLGLLAQRRPHWRGPVLWVLNLLQTIPSLALFGLLLGIGAGIGLLPALIALTLYSLLIPVRAVVAGLDEVPAALREAAAGMGMTPRQVLLHLDLPLALPVLLSGLRVAAVQAVGLAAVAALIGAGGLGAIVFQGLYADALDLVMLGVVPMALLALAIDGALRGAAMLSRRAGPAA